ncbi:MAG TPA: PKD domain-containing protein, partial [Flavipsychrobacter sp.]|nr:PKD domain-containing protein [Flavipsychrobacter sp.]
MAQAPVASFTKNISAGCPPQPLVLTDNSTNSPTTLSWTITGPSGTTSYTGSNVSTVLSLTGTYTIQLTATNASGSNSTSQNVIIYSYPVVDFSVNDTTQTCAPKTLLFTNLTTPNAPGPVNYNWNFGDGNTSTATNPSNTYAIGGNFSVTLVATIANAPSCVSSLVKTNYIKLPLTPTPNFSSSNNSPCTAPAVVNFTNTTGNATSATTYSWTFGGPTTPGTFTGTTPPGINYSTTGTFPVTLVATNASCSASTTKSTFVNIGLLSAAFTPTSQIVCRNQPVSFTNTSTPSPTAGTAVWHFGDGTTASGTNAIHVYTTAGTYYPFLVLSGSGCQDTSTLMLNSVTVSAGPTASFVPNPAGSCSAATPINFNNTTTGGTSYVWDFGDGSATSTAATPPAHTFPGIGTYNVKLVATGPGGCKDSVTIPVVIGQSTMTITASPYGSYCPNSSIKFKAKLTPALAGANYTWNFGDGTGLQSSGTVDSIFHTYANLGSYTVSVTATTPGCAVNSTLPITINTKPNANFSFSPNNVCPQTPVIFSNSSTGTTTSYTWYFGGHASPYTGFNPPPHNFPGKGTYIVSLVADNAGCADTAYQNPVITFPKADYIPIQSCSAAPNVITFQDASLSEPGHMLQYFVWFNNNATGPTSANPGPPDFTTTSVSQPPLTTPIVWTYPVLPGIVPYNVNWMVVDHISACTSSIVATVFIMYKNSGFTATTDSLICVGESVTFQNSFSVNRDRIDSTVWDFGDGTAAVPLSPYDSVITHKYNTPGVFTVKLRIKDVLGCRDSVVKTGYIKVGDPLVHFGASPPKGCIPFTANFIDSTNTYGIGVQSYRWDYGNGTTSPPGASGTNTYTAVGQYSVKLVVTDNAGCVDSLTRYNYIETNNLAASFATNDTIICPNLPANFTNTTPNATTITWNFGDGSPTASGQTVSHTYVNSGTYTVTMSVVDINGCSATTTKNVQVAPIHLGFIISDTFKLCAPLFDTLISTSTGVSNILWQYSTGSSVNDTAYVTFFAGTYTVKLKGFSGGGCVDSISQTVTVGANNDTLVYTPKMGCVPLTVNFSVSTPTQQFQWIMGNGFSQTTGVGTYTYTYTQAGKYLPAVFLKDPSDPSCVFPLLGLDTIVVEELITDFSYTPINACTYNMQFRDTVLQSINPLTTRSWNFGDPASGANNTSTLHNPTHQFSGPGTYTVRYISSTSVGCGDTVTKTVVIPPAPVATSTLNVSICQGQSYSFKGTTYTSSITGVKDTVKTSLGCDSVITLNLTVSSYITRTLNITICQGQSYTFKGITYTAAVTGVMDTTKTSAGCDSITTLNLAVSPYLTGTDTHVMCQGQSYSFNGVNYTTPNTTAKDTFKNAAGCDSIVTLNLSVTPYLTGIQTHVMCQGQSYSFNGVNYTAANTTATDTFKNGAGCDSIVTLNLSVSPYLTGTFNHSICQGQSYSFN